MSWRCAWLFMDVWRLVAKSLYFGVVKRTCDEEECIQQHRAGQSK
jgi:hypothetical protein